MEYTISLLDNPSAEKFKNVEEGLRQFTESVLGQEERTEVAYVLCDNEDAVVGGVKGNYGKYGWLWVETLWILPEVRKSGYGTMLMERIEKKAMEQGCTNAYLNTFDFQALDFYRKRAYTVFAELEDFPEGYTVYCLRKKLV